MKKLILLLPVLLAGCSWAVGYPAQQICIERDIRSGLCTRAEFSCKHWNNVMLVFDRGEARCV